MALNEVYNSQPKFMDINVGNTTTKSGDPVAVGGFNGVAQNNSDGLSVGGVAPHPIAGETIQDTGRYQAPGHCTVAVSGVHRVPLVAAAAMAYGAPVYFKNGALQDSATGATLWGYLYDSRITGAMTIAAFVAVACPIA